MRNDGWTSSLFGTRNTALNNYKYAIEKLTNALECLATHPGDARERVASAYLVCAGLRVEDLPEKSKKDWLWIISELTKRGPLTNYTGEVWRGSIENTMKSARKSTASKIAKKFFQIYWAVSENRQYA